jgi:hypothetical protein
MKIRGLPVMDVIEGITRDRVPNLVMANATFALGAALINKLSPSRTGFMVSSAIRPISGTAAINAFSVDNTISGAVFMSNIRIAEFDPVLYKCLWSFTSGVSLFGVAQPTFQYKGENDPGTFVNITKAPGANSWMDEVNPNRTALQSVSVVNYFIYLLILKRV